MSVVDTLLCPKYLLAYTTPFWFATFLPASFLNSWKLKPNSFCVRLLANRRTQKEFGFNFHELRKEAGKNVANQKGVVYASKYLGHSRVSTTDIYLGVSANTYREQMKDVKI